VWRRSRANTAEQEGKIMSNTKEIDRVLSRAADATDVPGVVAMAASDKATIYEGAFGRRNLNANPSMTLDTVGWFASMTKAVTATAAMQLVEQGKLALDGPARDYVPSPTLSSPQVLDGFDDSGKPKLRPAKRPITVRHLLTHTAGFSYDIWNPILGKYMADNGVPGIVTCQNAALNLPLMFDPGDAWQYGINIDWVGKIVEALSGQRLGDYFQKNIFGPLGMQDTSFTVRSSQQSRLASVHQRGEDGTLAPIEFGMPEEPEFQMGGGGLYSTVPDFMRFAQMLLGGGARNGTRVLRPETVDSMFQNHIGSLNVMTLKTVNPALSNDADFFPGMVQKWGISFVINTETAPTGRSAGSVGWTGLANSFFWIDRTKNVAGVYLTQMLPFFDVKSIALFRDFETAVYRSME
jgi:methyl acetate hydrolase